MIMSDLLHRNSFASDLLEKVIVCFMQIRVFNKNEMQRNIQQELLLFFSCPGGCKLMFSNINLGSQ